MKHKSLLFVVVSLALLTTARFAETCGPFLTEIRFTTHNGVLPGEFASGHPGVFRPHYVRRDLLLAYRMFSGIPFNDQELERTSDSNSSPGGVQAWLQARQIVPGLSAKADIVVDRNVPGEQYQSYRNCLEDAFGSASATLQLRIQQWGVQSPEVAEWVSGQDMVFQNCSAGIAIPGASNSTNRLLVADRQYQMAAARLYAEQYAQAESDFDMIAAAADSPWHEIAPYLAARVCIRQATIAGNESKLKRAADRLRAIIADPARKGLHAPAEGLLGFVLARLEPRQRLVALGNQLMSPGIGPQLDRY